jgi:hypothetical protein
MTDRELLELAAKAAGMEYSDLQWSEYDEEYVTWNPLVDDGDALRLAVKLMLHIGVNPGNKVFCLPTYSDKPTVHESCELRGIQDPYAATRRAIVRAAAEIGRAKRPLNVVHQMLQAEASVSYLRSDAETYGFEVSAAEAARACGVTPQTIRNWCRKHRIGRRFEGRWVVPAGAIKAIARAEEPKP